MIVTQVHGSNRSITDEQILECMYLLLTLPPGNGKAIAQECSTETAKITVSNTSQWRMALYALIDICPELKPALLRWGTSS